MSAPRVAVHFFYDVISPYSWLAFESLTRHAQVWPSVDLKLRPFFLGKIMAESKNKPPLLVKAKGMYMLHDLKRLGAFHGVPLAIPPAFKEYVFRVEEQRQQMLFVTAVDVVTDGRETEPVSRELFKAIFKEHTEVGKLPLAQLAQRAGLSAQVADHCLSESKSKRVEERLDKSCDEALAFGAFGAPTTVALLPSGPQLFFGCDRVELLAHTLQLKYHGALLCKSRL